MRKTYKDPPRGYSTELWARGCDSSVAGWGSAWWWGLGQCMVLLLLLLVLSVRKEASDGAEDEAMHGGGGVAWDTYMR